MAVKFKPGDLVKTTVTVGLDFQSFPIDSEARVIALIPRAGWSPRYIINLIAFNRDVAVTETEIEFATGPIVKPKTQPTYRKLTIPNGCHYIVEDNNGTHYTVVDTNDATVRIGSIHNKNLFVNCKEDTSYVHLPRGTAQTQAEVIASQAKGCQHDWKFYQGLSESFDYCKTCDAKRKKQASA